MIDALKMCQASTEPEAQVLLADAPAAATMALAAEVQPLALDVAEPITLQQAKDHLRVVAPDEDAYIQGLIVAAREMAEDQLNRTIVQRSRVARFSGWGADLALLKPPVITLDSVSYYDETGGEVELDMGRYFLQPVSEDEIPRVELRAGEPFPVLDARRFHAVTVRYTAGYPVGQVPAPIVQWMLLNIGTMYENRSTVINGSISQQLAGDFVRWLLQRYKVYE